ncbi:hypothetical protein N7532_003897 [Penicillium argentinense]|uniref:Zn(2)-C6 fungal-type domain-containing protein n=1 Tax=Penicillium argentinense TaxID=1131581 RepID=A0A9W9FNH3_9EURO|nr:uncharacterized protein N7532_003897 [Penicillium argentinense]KAJ5103368.1 hypothetical protein N7532_003897 [Penicillium argentinense]
MQGPADVRGAQHVHGFYNPPPPQVKMKRNNRGDIISLAGRWTRPPLSCLACREKKRRCDRAQPCSNCLQRRIPCEYSGSSPEAAGTSDSLHGSTHNGPSESLEAHPTNQSELGLRCLPPLRQARELFNHFANTLQPTFGVLHIPTARNLMEKTYKCMLEGEEPHVADLMLMFAIFAGAALVWTPRVLEDLNTTKAGAKAAFMAYVRTALAILEHPDQLIQPSTTALVAIGTLGHLLMNTDGFPIKVHLLRHRCLLMSRDMQIHRLDTAQSREERRIKGCDMIDVEVQRRAWWNMVASDWLLSFSGGPQEGAYTFQPKHMNVNLPSNTDDEMITTSGVQQAYPLSVPTSMSAFIARVQGSELCREVIDALPSILLDSQYADYSVILELDAKYQTYMDNLPFFFKLDPASIEQSRQICKERPYIAWQRVSVHFSLHTRLCRLHRQYHLEGATNPKYAYSHKVCIQSAQKVLELRRSMDEISAEVELNPGRFWTVMHHVFFAALILAMDVSFNPQAPDAEARKAKVLAAYQTLEKSKQDSSNLMEGIQKNLQTLMSTLHKSRSQVPVRDPGAARGDAFTEPSQASYRPGELTTHDLAAQPSSTVAANSGFDLGTVNDIDQEGWEQLWSEFVAVAPELDVPQWSSLLEDVDFNPQLDVY